MIWAVSSTLGLHHLHSSHMPSFGLCLSAARLSRLRSTPDLYPPPPPHHHRSLNGNRVSGTKPAEGPTPVQYPVHMTVVFLAPLLASTHVVHTMTIGICCTATTDFFYFCIHLPRQQLGPFSGPGPPPYRLDLSTVSRLDLSAVSRLELSAVSRLDLSAVSRLDHSAVSRLELSAVSRLDLSAVSRLELSAVSRLDLSAVSRLELSAVSRLDLSAVSRLDLSAVSPLCPVGPQCCVPPRPQCCVPPVSRLDLSAVFRMKEQGAVCNVARRRQAGGRRKQRDRRYRHQQTMWWAWWRRHLHPSGTCPLVMILIYSELSGKRVKMDQDWSVQYMVDGEEGEENCSTMLHEWQCIGRYIRDLVQNAWWWGQVCWRDTARRLNAICSAWDSHRWPLLSFPFFSQRRFHVSVCAHVSWTSWPGSLPLGHAQFFLLYRNPTQ